MNLKSTALGATASCHFASLNFTTIKLNATKAKKNNNMHNYSFVKGNNKDVDASNA